MIPIPPLFESHTGADILDGRDKARVEQIRAEAHPGPPRDNRLRTNETPVLEMAVTNSTLRTRSGGGQGIRSGVAGQI